MLSAVILGFSLGLGGLPGLESGKLRNMAASGNHKKSLNQRRQLSLTVSEISHYWCDEVGTAPTPGPVSPQGEEWLQ